MTSARNFILFSTYVAYTENSKNSDRSSLSLLHHSIATTVLFVKLASEKCVQGNFSPRVQPLKILKKFFDFFLS